MYVPFPSLPASEILARSVAIDAERLRVSPGEALRSSGISAVDRFRVVSRIGEPIYVLQGDKQNTVAISGLDGQVATVTAAESEILASNFHGSKVSSVDGPINYDQWVVSNDFDALRPFYRVTLDDLAGTVLYVSESTGELSQRTTRRQRAWNYVGAVIHWIYPTILRKSFVAWDSTVWWLSLIGILATITGIVLGISRTRMSLAKRTPKISPFRNWFKWHHTLGLFGALFVLTWIVSGWLSMDHGRLFSVPDPEAGQIALYRGMDLSAASAAFSKDDFLRDGPVHAAAISAVAGVPYLHLVTPGRAWIRTASAAEGIVLADVPESDIHAAVRAAWAGAEIIESYQPLANDAYGHLRGGSLPPTAVRLVLNDARKTWVHVDKANGQILSVMDRSRRIYRWLFNGLHSLDFPRFVDWRPGWDFVMLALLCTGFAFSATAVVLGQKRLRLSARRRPSRSRPSAS